jgi:hypothetical protein
LAGMAGRAPEAQAFFGAFAPFVGFHARSVKLPRKAAKCQSGAG